MRLDNKNRKLIKEIEKRTGLSTEQILEIVKSPSRFIRETTSSIEINRGMTQEQFEKTTYNFNIPFIGKLFASYSNYKKYYEKTRPKRRTDNKRRPRNE